jgi:hypothetical protein
LTGPYLSAIATGEMTNEQNNGAMSNMPSSTDLPSDKPREDLFMFFLPVPVAS